jgi:hypothetical protein
VLRAAGETETTKENIQDWLDGEPGFQLLVFLYFLNKGPTVIFFLFSSALPILLNFPFISLLIFCPLGLSFASLIRIIA